MAKQPIPQHILNQARTQGAKLQASGVRVAEDQQQTSPPKPYEIMQKATGRQLDSGKTLNQQGVTQSKSQAAQAKTATTEVKQTEKAGKATAREALGGRPARQVSAETQPQTKQQPQASQQQSKQTAREALGGRPPRTSAQPQQQASQQQATQQQPAKQQPTPKPQPQPQPGG